MIANDSIEFNGRHFSKFLGKHIFWGLGCSKLKAAHLVTYFHWFLGKNIKNCPPSKLFLFIPPCNVLTIRGPNKDNEKGTLSYPLCAILQQYWLLLLLDAPSLFDFRIHSCYNGWVSSILQYFQLLQSLSPVWWTFGYLIYSNCKVIN